MRKLLILFLLLIFAFTLTGCFKKPGPALKVEEEKSMTTLSGKKVLMIIASKDFRDEEYLKPREILEREGIEVKVASSSLEEAQGMFGTQVKPDISLDEVNVADFEAIIFVGGVGASEYWDNSTAHKIVKETVVQNKVLAAICLAPVTLAKAGVLSGKKATVWSSEKGELEENGAEVVDQDVVVDGKIITGSGPQAAQEFGKMIVRVLAE